MGLHPAAEDSGTAAEVIYRPLAPVFVRDKERKGLAPVPFLRELMQIDVEAVVYKAHLLRPAFLGSGLQAIDAVSRVHPRLPCEGIAVQVKKTRMSHGQYPSQKADL